jgi:tRNA(Ile)-lysidine synthase TilS/MesJ
VELIRSALLLALDELLGARKINVEIVVAHLNHKLRGADSNADARLGRSLPAELGHEAVGEGRGYQEARPEIERQPRASCATRPLMSSSRQVAKSRKARFVLTGAHDERSG